MNPIDANTISNFTPLSREEFRTLMTYDTNESFLKKMPSTSEDIEDKTFDIVHIVEDVFLARGKIGTFTLEKRSCNACAMSRYSCHTDEDGELQEIPCDGNFTGENMGYTAIRAQIVSLPTNGKKNEYIPDTPENFDFSPESWNSVKTMIGM